MRSAAIRCRRPSTRTAIPLAAAATAPFVLTAAVKEAEAFKYRVNCTPGAGQQNVAANIAFVATQVASVTP